MTAKEYLEQAYTVDKRIRFAYDEIVRLREMAENISSPKLEERVQTSKSNEAPFVKYVDKLLEKEEEIKLEVDKLVKLQDDIIRSIELVDDFTEQTVLKYRYIYNYSWVRIAKKLNMCRSSVIAIYNKALENFSEKFKK
jgi:DNA-directed RNA polymerase specialized sigma subunit